MDFLLERNCLIIWLVGNSDYNKHRNRCNKKEVRKVNSNLTKECDCMVNTLIFSILGIGLLGGLVYLFTLIVKALKKYINSDKTQTDK